MELTADPYEAARGAHAIAVVTEWDLYRDLDYARIFESMEKPAFLIEPSCSKMKAYGSM